MEVKVQGCYPPSLRQYNYPDEANPYIQWSVDSLLEQGVIRPCLSPLLSQFGLLTNQTILRDCVWTTGSLTNAHPLVYL